jgi:hypothetical protein
MSTTATLRITYSTSIKVPAGWRTVTVQAIAERISAGMAKVVKVELIDHDAPGYGQSRTGARRQEFNGKFWAEREIGAKKRISSLSGCEVLTYAAAI